MRSVLAFALPVAALTLGACAPVPPPPPPAPVEMSAPSAPTPTPSATNGSPAAPSSDGSGASGASGTAKEGESCGNGVMGQPNIQCMAGLVCDMSNTAPAGPPGAQASARPGTCKKKP